MRVGVHGRERKGPKGEFAQVLALDKQVLDGKEGEEGTKAGEGKYCVIEAGWVSSWLAFVYYNDSSPAPGTCGVRRAACSEWRMVATGSKDHHHHHHPHALAHTRTHAPPHTHTRTRTHARTHARTQARFRTRPPSPPPHTYTTHIHAHIHGRVQARFRTASCSITPVAPSKASNWRVIRNRGITGELLVVTRSHT